MVQVCLRFDRRGFISLKTAIPYSAKHFLIFRFQNDDLVSLTVCFWFFIEGLLEVYGIYDGFEALTSRLVP